jgi:hypothetical protein
MADTSTLKYTVDGYDPAHKVLFVTFPDEGRKVNIGIQTFPTTQADLDAIVKPFAAPVEAAAEAIAAAKADDPSFVASIVGKTHVTARISAEAAKGVDTTTANDLVVGDTTLKAENVKSADVAYIKALIAEVLADQAKAVATTATTEAQTAAPAVATTTTEAS